MAANEARKWARAVTVVAENFRKLIDKATTLITPNDNADVYGRRKFQLVYSMLCYITRIISDGIKLAMKGKAPDLIHQVLNDLYRLQQDLLQLGNFPHDLENACRQFDDEMDFRCLSRKPDTIVGQGTITELSMPHIGKGVALVA
jgi:hypothetical protein